MHGQVRFLNVPIAITLAPAVTELDPAAPLITPTSEAQPAGPLIAPANNPKAATLTLPHREKTAGSVHRARIAEEGG
jgi:hypothetical protein